MVIGLNNVVILSGMLPAQGGIRVAKALKVDSVWLNRIAEQLNDMEFGSLHITVHEGQIVQMERTERKRFGNSPSLQAVRKTNSGSN
ncbi:hypothetical protein D3C74_17870 [compost metagenome]